MKKRIVIISFLVMIIVILYIDQHVKVKYSIGIVNYVQYSFGLNAKDKKILEKYQPLIYSGNINEPPLGHYYEDSGQYLGMVVDRINALSIELGVPILSHPMIWNEALSALAKGETDLCDMVPSQERSEYFLFSDPIYILRGVAVVPKENDEIRRLQDLNGMKIAVQAGDYAIEVINQKLQVEIIETASLSEAMNLLYNGKADAVVGDEPVARYLMNELTYTDKYRVLDEVFYENPCAFALPKSHADLLEVINKGIFSMKSKGVMDKIEAKWSGYHTSLLRHAAQKDQERLNFLAAGLITIIALYLIYLWNRSLKLFAEAKTMELNLVQNELKIIFDGMADYLVVVGQDAKIKNINKPFLKYLNLDDQGIIGKPFDSIAILEDFENKYHGLLILLLSGEKKADEINPGQKFELKLRDRIYSVTLHALGKESSESDDVLIMISDITLARSEEQRLIETNRMKTIGQLAAGVAHELRTPLGTIRNSVFLLQGDSSNHSLAEENHHGSDSGNEIRSVALGSINKAVDRASNIIENLLKFSRLTNGEKQWIDLKESILESVLPSQISMEKQGIELKLLCDPGLTIYINRDSMNHILINLIQNAVDAMPKGGLLQIHCYRSNDENKDVLIRVTDNGIGIDEHSIEKIFEPFYSTKAVGKGTGLGLYVVYSEVRKSNGEITVESKPNIGTTFTIRFPNGGMGTWAQV